MKRMSEAVVALMFLVCGLVAFAQQAQVVKTEAVVPPLVNFSGVLTDANGKAMSGTVGVTFLLYKEEQGRAPLWLETQNVQADSHGRYTVTLGATTSHGLPSDIFVAGEARWLGVQAVGQAEQPRALLVSAPYALKAGDAQTLGGLPASAFVQAATSPGRATTAPPPGTITGVTAGTDLTGGGTSGNVTLNLDTSKVPTLGANNTFTGTQTIKNTTTMSGTNSSGVLQVTNTATSGTAPAINATTDSTGASGVRGNAIATSGTSNGVFGNTTSPGGYGVLGQQYATSGSGAGVFGSTPSMSGYGVEGTSAYVGVYGTTLNYSGDVTGVRGDSWFTGVYGTSNGSSNEFPAVFAGVWGDTGGSSEGGFAGVWGTAVDNYGAVFYNDSATIPTLYLNNYGGGSTGSAFLLLAQGKSGNCLLDSGGNVACTGKVSSVVPTQSGAREVSLYSMQSPENWFEDFGSGQLRNGVARVEIDSTFAQTVNTGVQYHVFLTPNGDCKGLYVAQKTLSSFEVHELGGGQSNVAFDYRITAKRSGYENTRMQDVTAQSAVLKAQVQRMNQRPSRKALSQRRRAQQAMVVER